MLDIAVLKRHKVAGVKEDDIDSDGEIELMHRVEPDVTIERCMIFDQAKTEDCLAVDEEPEAVLVNYNNFGYARVKFDAKSESFLLDNLRYVTSVPIRTYIWRIFRDMWQTNELSLFNWFRLISNNLKFETEDQTLQIILEEILTTWKQGLFTEDQILAIFNTVSRMELQIQDMSKANKSAMINEFCSQIVSSGIVIDPAEFTPENCYEVIGYQCKSSKQQLYTFMRLLFANPKLPTDKKVAYMDAISRMDAKAIKLLDDMLDSQGGFTPQAAERHLKEFGPYSDLDALLQHGCYAMIPDFEHKKKLFYKYLHQIDYTVKTLDEAGKYIYCGLKPEQLAEMASDFYAEIERVFADHHRDYAQTVFQRLCPSFLGRPADLEQLEQILNRVGDSNTHFSNLLKTEIFRTRVLIKNKEEFMARQKESLKEKLSS